MKLRHSESLIVIRRVAEFEARKMKASTIDREIDGFLYALYGPTLKEIQIAQES